jgi:hypothetical protein
MRKGIAPMIIILMLAIAIPIIAHFGISLSVTTNRISRDVAIIRDIDNAEFARNFLDLSNNYSIMQGASATAEKGGKVPDNANDLTIWYWYNTNATPSVIYPNQSNVTANTKESMEKIYSEYMQSAILKGVGRLTLPTAGSVDLRIDSRNESFNTTLQANLKSKYEFGGTIVSLPDSWFANYSIRIFDQFIRGRNFIDRDVIDLDQDVRECINGYPMGPVFYRETHCPSPMTCPTTEYMANKAFTQECNARYPKCANLNISQAQDKIEQCAMNAVSAAQLRANSRDSTSDYKWSLPIFQNDATINYTCNPSPPTCNAITCGGGDFPVSTDGWDPATNSVRPVNVDAWDYGVETPGGGWFPCDKVDDGLAGARAFCQNRAGADDVASGSACYYRNETQRNRWNPYTTPYPTIEENTGQGASVIQILCHWDPEPGYTTSTTCNYGYQEILQVNSTQTDIRNKYPIYSYSERQTGWREMILKFLVYIKATRF